jgi:hypothetical protein
MPKNDNSSFYQIVNIQTKNRMLIRNVQVKSQHFLKTNSLFYKNLINDDPSK